MVNDWKVYHYHIINFLWHMLLLIFMISSIKVRKTNLFFFLRETQNIKQIQI